MGLNQASAVGSGNAATNLLAVSARGNLAESLSGLPEPGWPYGQPVICRLSDLRHHPGYVRLGLTVPASRLSALAEQGELAFREPLVITKERVVIDGYTRWELARLKGRLVLPCIEYDLTEEAAILWLLQKHRRSSGLNDFCRILLAKELEPSLKLKALSNQRHGGRMKGSSNLTEDAAVDVRKEVAASAGVSVGNVTKVRQLMGVAHQEVLEALREGEVSIHRAWKWSRESPDRQIEELRACRAKRGVAKSIRDLISRHKQNQSRSELSLTDLAGRLAELEPDRSNSITVSVIRAPGKMIFVTEELLQCLPPCQGSSAICKTAHR
jgi:hypothetical protein